MMHLDQQSRWRSWMRILAVTIQSAPASAPLIGSVGSGVSAPCHAAMEGRTSLTIELKATSKRGRSNEITD